jgi:O-antigen/teichoic acid export membrane protein
MKLVAGEVGNNNLKNVEGYVVTAIITIAISGLSVFAIVILLKVPIVGLFKLSPQNTETALDLLPYMAGLSVYVFTVQIFTAVLSGLGRIDQANYCDVIGRFVALCVSGILLANGTGIESMLIGSAISYLFINVLTYVMIRRLQPIRIISFKNVSYVKFQLLLKIGSGMFGSSLISMLLGPFNKMVIARYIGVSSLPLYEIAFNATMQLRGLFEAGFRAIAPEVSRLSSTIKKVDAHKIATIYKRAMKIIFTWGALAWFTLIIFATPSLKIWLGIRYVEDLSIVFKIMLAGTYVSLLGVPAYYVFVGLGATNKIFIHNVIQSCTNAFLVFILLQFRIDLSIEKLVIVVVLSWLISNGYLIFQMPNKLKDIAV